jgi:hypothetical protein
MKRYFINNVDLYLGIKNALGYILNEECFPDKEERKKLWDLFWNIELMRDE